MDRLRQARGNWVVGERFWGRETDIDLFVEAIATAHIYS